MSGKRICPGAGGAHGMAGVSMSHGHGRGSPSTSIPYPGDLSRQRGSWVDAAAGKGVWELKERLV